VNGDGVTTWRQAHQIAMMAATRAHRDFGVDTSEPPIDVASAIVASGAKLMWLPLPRLFGMYVNQPGSLPGIAVNSALPHGARRHTAAHELGHRLLGHATGTDDGNTIETTFSEEDELPTRRRAWPDHEKVAEAFASWFLMPRRAVLAALARLGMDQPRSAQDVYRLSLVLGTSYRTTLRHLPNLRLLSPALAAQHMRTPPGRIKSQMDGHCQPPASRNPDVWLITSAMAGMDLEVRAGDRIVLDLAGSRLMAYPQWLTPVPAASGAAIPPGRDVLECQLDLEADREPTGQDNELDETTVQSGPIAITHEQPDQTNWAIVITRRPGPLGVDQRCLSGLEHAPHRQEN
jgi:Zn-dependent peptidase ImmA (M78 family)